MTMVDSSQRLPIAQTLPADVLIELYGVVAKSDPPVRKHVYPSNSATSFMFSLPRSNQAKEPLGPTWSQIPPAGADREDRGGLTRPTADQASLGWILLTHVCSRWRTIGLSLSSLWGGIFSIFPKLDVAKTLLSRARDASLTFDMDALSSSWSGSIFAFENLAKQHLASAGTITFPVEPDSSTWYITLLYRDEFPLLKDLRAQVLYRPNLHPTFPYPKPFAPSLKHLVLHTFIPFTAPNLTNLELSLDEYTREAEVRALLSSSPLLEEFLLQWGWERRPEITSISPLKHLGKLHLPNLSVASFTVSRAIVFSQGLDIPSHAKLSFFAYSELDIPFMLDVIGPRLRDSKVNAFSLSQNWSVDTFGASVHAPNTEPSPRVFMTAHHGNRALDTTLALFHQILIRTNPDKVGSLHVDPYSPSWSLGPLEGIINSVTHGLRALSALTSLSVACVPMAREWPFLEALRGSSTTDSPTFAPALQTLIIYSDDTLLDQGFTKTEVECVQHRWDKIIFILERRQEIGLPLRRLVLEGARGDDPAIASINDSGFARAALLVDEVIDNRKDHALTVVES